MACTLCDIHGQQVGGGVVDREELSNVIRSDEELCVVLADRVDPFFLDDAVVVADDVFPHHPGDVNLQVVVGRAHAINHLMVLRVRAPAGHTRMHPHKLELRIACEHILHLVQVQRRALRRVSDAPTVMVHQDGQPNLRCARGQASMRSAAWVNWRVPLACHLRAPHLGCQLVDRIQPTVIDSRHLSAHHHVRQVVVATHHLAYAAPHPGVLIVHSLHMRYRAKVSGVE